MVSTRDRKKLYKASKKGREDEVRLLLNKVTKSRVLARSLYKASKHGQENVTNLLLNRVTDDAALQKALHIATVRNHANVVSILLDKSPSLGIAYALRKASKLGHANVARTLINKAKEVGDLCRYNAQAYVEIAAKYGQVSIVCLIRDHIISDKCIFTDVLINAARHGDKTMVKCFLDKLADREVLRYLTRRLPEEVLPLILEKLPISEVASMLPRTNGHPESFYRCISAYLKELEPNLTLSTEGREIKVHKEVVSYWSSYFQAAFRFEDKRNYEFDPHIVSFRALKVIVDFCYSGTCGDFGSRDVTRAADYLGINLPRARDRYDLRSMNM